MEIGEGGGDGGGGGCLTFWYTDTEKKLFGPALLHPFPPSLFVACEAGPDPFF